MTMKSSYKIVNYLFLFVSQYDVVVDITINDI